MLRGIINPPAWFSVSNFPNLRTDAFPRFVPFPFPLTSIFGVAVLSLMGFGVVVARFGLFV